MKLVGFLIVASLCAAVLGRSLPKGFHKVDEVNEWNDALRIPIGTGNNNAELVQRAKRSLIIFVSCPENQKRLPPPLNRCIPIKEYESYMEDYPDEGENST